MRNELVASVCAVAAAQDGAIGAAQLRALGISARAQRCAVAAGWLRPARPGVLAVAHFPQSWRQRLRAGLLALDGAAWVSHDAAAHLHGLAGSVATIEFTVSRPSRGRVGASAVHTTAFVATGDVVIVDGMACSSVARTVLDVAALGIPTDRLCTIVGDALRTGRTDAGTLRARLATLRGSGRRGVRPLERLLTELAEVAAQDGSGAASSAANSSRSCNATPARTARMPATSSALGA